MSRTLPLLLFLSRCDDDVFFSFLAGVFLFVHVLARPLRGDLVSTFDHDVVRFNYGLSEAATAAMCVPPFPSDAIFVFTPQYRGWNLCAHSVRVLIL